MSHEMLLRILRPAAIPCRCTNCVWSVYQVLLWHCLLTCSVRRLVHLWPGSHRARVRQSWRGSVYPGRRCRATPGSGNVAVVSLAVPVRSTAKAVFTAPIQLISTQLNWAVELSLSRIGPYEHLSLHLSYKVML